jgi:hypothetical protein
LTFSGSVGTEGLASASTRVVIASAVSFEFFSTSPGAFVEAGVCTFVDSMTVSSTLAILLLFGVIVGIWTPSATPALVAGLGFLVALSAPLILVLRLFFP